MSDAPGSSTPRVPRNKSAKAAVWRRRALVAVVGLVLLVMLVRLVISLALPLVLGRVVAFYNMSCTYDRLQLSIIDGNLNIFNLTLRPKDGGEPIAHADFIYGDLFPLELFRGRLHVARAEVDGIDLNVDRNPDGSIPLLQRLLPATTASSTSTTTTTPPRPVDLQSPLKVEAFVLSHLTAHIHDRHVSPELDAAVRLTVRVSDLGVPGKSTNFEIGVSSDQLLEDMRLTGQAKADGKSLDAQMAIAIRNLHPAPAAGYLSPVGIRPTADSISMQMNAALSATPSASTPGALTGSLAIDHLSAEADAEQSIRVDKVNVAIDTFDPTALHLSQVLVSGVRVNTSRTHEGVLRACGIELTKPTQSAAPTAEPQAVNGGPAYAVSVASVHLHDCRVDLADQAIAPAAALAVQLDDLTVAAPGTGGPLAIVGVMSLPGIANQINLSGSTSPFSTIKTANVMLRVQGLDPVALKPYLDSLGLQSQFKNGSFGCDLAASLSPTPDGSFSADAHLSNVKLDNGAELLGLTGVTLKGVSADARRIRFDSIDVAGPTLVVERDADGAVSVLGLKTKAKPSVAAAPVPTTGPTTATVASQTQPAVTSTPAPRIEIGKFVWNGVHVHLEDKAVSPPQTIAIDDVGVEIHDLKLGLDPSDYAANSGKIKAWFVAPHFVDRLDLTGTVAPGPNALQLDLNVAGTGVSPAALTPYLKPLGIQPLTQDGSIGLHAQVTVAKKKSDFDISLQLDDFRYASADSDLLSVDGLQVGHVQIGGNELPIGDVVIDHPQARIERDADGSLIFAGIKLLQQKPSPPAPATVPSPSAPSAPFIGSLASLQIHHAALSWTDRAMQPTVTTSLTSDIDLKDLTIGRPAEPADLHIIASIPGVMREATVTGQVSPAPGDEWAHLNINAGGIALGPLAAYLPPGITSTLTNGSAKLALDAHVAANPAGGQSAKLLIDGLDYRDANSTEPLFKMDNLSLIGSRIDPAGGVIALDEVSTRGIELSAVKAPGGALRVLGLSVGSAPPTTKAATTEPATTTPEVASGLTAAQMVAAEKKPLPLITLNKLDLNVHRVSLIDSTRPKAAALSLIDLRLQNKNRIEWLGPDAASRPATQLLLTSQVSPLVDQLSVAAKVTPFALHPAVGLDLAVTGIHGSGLTQLAPELADKIDGSAMTNGRADAHLDAVLKLDRRVPTDFDFSVPFAAEFSLTNVSYRSSPDSPVLGGLDEVRAEDIRVRPAAGDVEVKSLEITKPALLVVRQRDGIHTLGWTILLPAPTTQPTTRPTTAPAVAVASKASAKASATPAPTTKPAPPTGEIKIDRILASGMDVRIEDRTTNPVTVIPLSGLDLEVRDLSSLAPYQDKPVRFSALINSGKVSLPARSGNGMEQRDLFSQISANGKVGLYPQTNGWAKVAVSGFDLSGLTGEAAAQNITLTHGAFDSNVDLRFQPGNVVDVSSKLIVTDLSLSEPPKGPLSTVFRLPAPLDVCIGAVEDPDGSITLPLNFAIKDARPEGIAGAAIGAVSSVVVTAVASAPVKVVGDVSGLLGLGPKKPGEEVAVVLPYDPGTISLEGPGQSSILFLAKRMVDEPNLDLTIAHNFGAGDVASIAGRANPSADDAKAIAYQLRSHKLELSSLRAQVAGQAEAQLAAFDETDAGQTLDRLRAIDRELAQTEDALDRTYDLLRPGAQRQADRRTRAAALEVAAERLDGIRALLRGAGVPDVEHRIHLVHPTFTPSDSTPNSSVVVQPVRTRGQS